MAWKNGGGTTTEIAIAPEGAALGGARFVYRVSIADVTSDGPFSRFDGCDRHIMLLAGAGMTLDCGPHGQIGLTTPFEAHAFSGDWDVVGTLVHGPVRDFNVIVDRTRATATLEVRVLASPETIACAPFETCLLHVLDGALTAAAAGDTLIADAAVNVAPRGQARVVVVRIAASDRMLHADHGSPNATRT
jgi:environmental stress-induced protein Ves